MTFPQPRGMLSNMLWTILVSSTVLLVLALVTPLMMLKGMLEAHVGSAVGHMRKQWL